MSTVYVGLGSNLGDREPSLLSAVEQLRKIPHTRLLRTSRWQETEPVGGPPQGKFLNGAVELETSLPPQELLSRLQKIEQELGRPAEHDSQAPRTIDLDLLAYDSLVLQEPALEIPHPRMHQRPFVLIPLAEIAPDWKHPTLGKTARELLTECGSSATSKS